MTCERCGRPITETHICTPTLGYFERELMQLKIKTEHLEKLIGLGEGDDQPARIRDYRVVYCWTEEKSGGAETRSIVVSAYDAKDAHYRADLLKKPIGDPNYRVIDILPETQAQPNPS